MIRTLIIAKDAAAREEFRRALPHHELACSFTTFNNGVREAVTCGRPEVIIFEMGEPLPAPATWELVRKTRQSRNVPLIALIPAPMLDKVDSRLEFDDFLVSPYDARELTLRINRLFLTRGGAESDTSIKCNDLVLDTATCEVTVAGSKTELTFKEYELLKLLASHRGRVFTREALLDKIWGYDYYGGDRTVDVHIRRLRSKIERTGRVYIETVRNIGYRFAKDA
ncbi:MAG: hypothetical protein A2137_03915 [Chloroflexi bacterium RBG_16_58_8]|nr:MAG: hypothetical protein A2137_03915 [Chloroflexi bacterium RBG_16_58_8]